jgi:hypothetical protein
MDRGEILNGASNLTCGARDGEYGSPMDNMQHIANLWTAYLDDRLASSIGPDDVAWMCALIKAARRKTSPQKADHYLDGAAYIAIAGECANAE